MNLVLQGWKSPQLRNIVLIICLYLMLRDREPESRTCHLPHCLIVLQLLN